MLPYHDSRVTQIVLGLFFIIIILYAYYEARGLLYGPRIDVPSQVTVVHEPFVTIQGTAKRISQLTMNGKPVTVTEEGVFKEPYLLSEGYNRIALWASDKYGRTRERVVQISYIPAATTSAAASSTTNATTTN